MKSHQIDIVHVHNANRIIAFRRWDDPEELLVVATLNNYFFGAGYTISSSHIPTAQWREVFNSDAQIYGGNNIGNAGATIAATNGNIRVVIPANGFIVLQRNFN